MPVNLDQLRADFRLAAKAEGWSDADQADIAAAIKAAIDGDDQAVLAYWASRCADSAAEWRAWCERVRHAEANKRTEVPA